MKNDASNRSLDYFLRYGPIIDDWEAFVHAANTPLPATAWANPLKTTPSQLQALLPIKPIAWYPGAFRFPPHIKPTHQLPYLAGHYQVQEEAALIPVHLMDPRPGETILDLCAAPGNKTVQMAVNMDSKGVVVANDRSEARLGILRRSIGRIGLTNIALIQHDAVSFAGEDNTYDKVLADVPCSGEGTIRRYKSGYKPLSEKRRKHLHFVQLSILKRAIQLCKPGGMVVYSTCTFAPEENEAIVDEAIRYFDGGLNLRHAEVQGLRTSPGLTNWEGVRFDQRLQNTLRIWPHHNDTGGFFVALIEKCMPTNTAKRYPSVPPLDALPLKASVAGFADRFGFPATLFSGYVLAPYGKFLYLRSFDRLPPAVSAPLQAGMPFCRPASKHEKLKTGAAMKWSTEATRNVIEITRAQANLYATRRQFSAAIDQIDDTTSPGYVLIKHKDMHLGLGFLRIHDASVTIESLLPKYWIHAFAAG